MSFPKNPTVIISIINHSTVKMRLTHMLKMEG
ncbi:hypothetical protein QFZ87_004745 [Bacillus sp. SLBN-46]|nr:hypothetical protein [Bacillus sp. SLBN-46]